MTRSSPLPPLLALLAMATPIAAQAEIPGPVMAMIDAALATGDEAKVATVIELAKTTNPDDAAELDAILARFQTDLAAAEAAEAAAEEEAIRNAGLFNNWSGKGELGAFTSTTISSAGSPNSSTSSVPVVPRRRRANSSP